MSTFWEFESSRSICPQTEAMTLLTPLGYSKNQTMLYAGGTAETARQPRDSILSAYEIESGQWKKVNVSGKHVFPQCSTLSRCKLLQGKLRLT